MPNKTHDDAMVKTSKRTYHSPEIDRFEASIEEGIAATGTEEIEELYMPDFWEPDE